ncbi:hypothetical protein Tco_0936187, partial [Tanacetum coccineum]
MPTSHTSVMSRDGLFIMYIIFSDFEDEDNTLPVVSTPSSLDRVLTSSSYSPNSDSNSEPTEDDSSNEDLHFLLCIGQKLKDEYSSGTNFLKFG